MMIDAWRQPTHPAASHIHSVTNHHLPVIGDHEELGPRVDPIMEAADLNVEDVIPSQDLVEENAYNTGMPNSGGSFSWLIVVLHR